MNKLLVGFIGWFAPLWRQLGADPRAIRHILLAKLRVSDRTLRITGGGEKVKEGNGAAIMVYVFLGLIGLFSLIFIFANPHLPTALSIGYTLTGVYLTMLLIMEFSENVYDTGDASILLSRPISEETFSLAKGLYVFTFSLKMMLAMSILPFIAVAVKAPLHLPIFVVASIAVATLATAGVLTFYQLLLRKLSTETFKKVISTLQMVISASIFMVYLIPQMISGSDGEGLTDIRLIGEWVGFLSPTFWIAAWHDWAEPTTYSYLQMGLGVVAVLVAGIAYRAQAGGYTDALMDLRGASSVSEAEDTADAATGGTVVGDSPWRERFARWFTRPGVERASFRFHWSMFLRSRSYKTKVYPTLVFAPLFVVFFILRDAFGSDQDNFFSGSLLFGLYYLSLTVITPLGQARMSDKPEAAWIWAAHPIAHRGPVIYGQYLASLAQFFLPTLAIIIPLFVYQGGLALIPDIMLAMGVAVIAGVVYQSEEETLPFSMAVSSQQMNSFGAFLAVAVVAGIAGVGHYFLRFIPYAIWIAAPLVWLAAYACLQWLRGLRKPFG